MLQRQLLHLVGILINRSVSNLKSTVTLIVRNLLYLKPVPKIGGPVPRNQIQGPRNWIGAGGGLSWKRGLGTWIRFLGFTYSSFLRQYQPH